MELYIPPVWHRRSDETPAAYIAFSCFRDLGPARTVNAAYAVSKGRKKDELRRMGRAPGRWYHWARDYAWSERAEAYDAHVEAEVTATNAGNIAAASRQSEETALLLQSKIAGEIFYFPGIETVPHPDNPQKQVPVPLSMQARMRRAQTLYRLAAAYRYATMTRLMAIGAPREAVDRLQVSRGTNGGRGTVTLSAVWEGYDEVLEEDGAAPDQV